MNLKIHLQCNLIKKRHKDNQLPPVNGPKPNGYHSNPNSTNPRKQEARKLNVDKDESGIYKARKNNYDNARTIEDNHNLNLDIPVNFRKAEEVKEEVLIIFWLFNLTCCFSFNYNITLRLMI